MNDDFVTAMRRSLQKTRAGDLMEATKEIQKALTGKAPAAAQAERPAKHQTRPRIDADLIEDAEILDSTPPRRRTLREVIAGLGRKPAAFNRQARPTVVAPEVPPGARFEQRTYTCAQGSRDYWLYIPARDVGDLRGVVLMLHGCTQTPEDFAAGTNMNAQAEQHGFAVIYPQQTGAHNASQCWNWFRPGDQGAAAGEPAILAGLSECVATEFGQPKGRVFAAGLSAGGAMAAILGKTHPDLFGAIGVHSGLAPGSAHDVISAFAAMRGEASGHARATGAPSIVFHGLADTTVAPANAARVAGDLRGVTQTRESINGRSLTRLSGENAEGQPVEIWEIEGMGHAWSGGKPGGSYTDPQGPDASAEMLRFFMAHSAD